VRPLATAVGASAAFFALVLLVVYEDEVRAVLGGRVWVSEWLHEEYRYRNGPAVPRWLLYTLRPLHVDWRGWRFVRVWWVCYRAAEPGAPLLGPWAGDAREAARAWRAGRRPCACCGLVSDDQTPGPAYCGECREDGCWLGGRA